MKKIVSHNKYCVYLESLKDISDVELFESGDVKFSCIVNDEWYAILLTSISDEDMPSVFLLNPDGDKCTKPHQQFWKKYGLVHLCLSVREDISVRNKTYQDILDYTIVRIKRLLSMNDKEEKREFRKEFLYYWNNASSNTDKINVFVKSSSSIHELMLIEKDKKIIVYDEHTILNENYVDGYKERGEKCIYIPLVNSSEIMPPLEELMWNRETIEYIFEHCISEKNIELLETYKFKDKSANFIFEMKVPEVIPILFMVNLRFCASKYEDVFSKIKNLDSIDYLKCQRCNSEYLNDRIGMQQQKIVGKIMVIGAGSLGSYIAAELPQLGIQKMTIFDNDDFSIDNLMRHRLGNIYGGMNKAFGMKFYLESSYPELSVTYEREKFDAKKIDGYNLDTYDLIIVSTGGTDFMMCLNREFKSKNLRVPVLFSWIESEGVGIHALFVDYRMKGCYQCLYEGTSWNKAHYRKEFTDSLLTGTGCGGVFNSYGNITLMKGSSLVLETIYKYIFGYLNYEKNPLFSIRSLSQSFPPIVLEKRNFEMRNDYYISKECPVCGD